MTTMAMMRKLTKITVIYVNIVRFNTDVDSGDIDSATTNGAFVTSS